jgi:hypothetical protein
LGLFFNAFLPLKNHYINPLGLNPQPNKIFTDRWSSQWAKKLGGEYSNGKKKSTKFRFPDILKI